MAKAKSTAKTGRIESPASLDMQTIKHPKTARPLPVDVTGYLVKNHAYRLDPERPAIIINPEASPNELLAWCVGEVLALEMSVRLNFENPNEQLSEFSALLYHRLEPLANAIEAAAEGFYELEKTA
jgi:hypothetical protein